MGTKFDARFKNMIVRSRDQFAHLEFECRPDQVGEVASLLGAIGQPVRLRVSGRHEVGGVQAESEVGLVDAAVSQVRFDGGGRSWVRFLADVGRAPELFVLVNREVEVEVE